ncbi:hypothetical protein C8R44DRAFT_893326 [Mycena epipterygia]|nr:hypothetical protein C8R44DRAFT_893326 [Mycena epipterygia]
MLLYPRHDSYRSASAHGHTNQDAPTLGFRLSTVANGFRGSHTHPYARCPNARASAVAKRRDNVIPEPREALSLPRAQIPHAFLTRCGPHLDTHPSPSTTPRSLAVCPPRPLRVADKSRRAECPASSSRHRCLLRCDMDNAFTFPPPLPVLAHRRPLSLRCRKVPRRGLNGRLAAYSVARRPCVGVICVPMYMAEDLHVLSTTPSAFPPRRTRASRARPPCPHTPASPAALHARPSSSRGS